ncbi:MAG: alpha-E domain-containing protein [Bacteroidetes bacterium]|nr:alpha-E domain-containing protein [Bacteroidota bacterium]
MLSRAADCLFWMSRYLERADHTARMTDVNLNLMTEGDQEGRERLIRLIHALHMPAPEAEADDLRPYYHRIAADARHPNSVLSCITSARENARQVREMLSTELWETLNRFYLDLRADCARQTPVFAESSFYKKIRERSFQIRGIADDTLSHSEPWQFIRLGRYLERMEATSELLRTYFKVYRLQPSQDHSRQYLEKVEILKYCSAFEPYSKVYTADFRFTWMAEFLLLNHDFPYSLTFSTRQVDYAITDLISLSGRQDTGDLRKVTGKIRSFLEFSTGEDILKDGIDAFLKRIEDASVDINKAVYQTFITYPIEKTPDYLETRTA